MGLTESSARELGHEVITASCPFAGNGKAVAMDDNSGFVKIVAEAESQERSWVCIWWVGMSQSWWPEPRE